MEATTSVPGLRTRRSAEHAFSGEWRRPGPPDGDDRGAGVVSGSTVMAGDAIVF
jgi:hypothetical protein